MKKRILFLGLLTFVAFNSKAQIYSQDFESASSLATMTTYGTTGATIFTDATLNGYGLTGTTFWAENNVAGIPSKAALTTSWFTSSTTQADNYLITPQISLPAATSCYVSFTAQSLGSASYLDPYQVKISATGNNKVDFTTTIHTNSAGAPNNEGGEAVTVMIPAMFEGQDVYIAFVGNGTDDYVIAFDNIVVDQLPADDIELVSLSNQSYAFGATSITGTVRNNGANTITSFTLDWNDGTSHSELITGVNIVPFGTYNFSHPTVLNAVGGTSYVMDVCATVPGDSDPSNNCQNQTINGVTALVDKYTIGEQKTGTWCGWCPRGHVGFHSMESTPNFIGIAVHNADPMVVSAYDSNIGTYVPGGYPGGGVDRVIVGDPGSASIASMHAQRVNMVPPASITVVAIQNGTNMEVTVTGNFVASMSGSYRLAAVIKEDGVTGTTSGYNQTNYYSFQTANLPLTGAGLNWQSENDPVPFSKMVYDGVARALGSNQILGAAGSLPGTITAGSSHSHTYTFAVNSDWNLANCTFVGMLVNASTGEIINAGQTKTYTGNVGIEENVATEFSIYPNPASDFTNVKFNLVENSQVEITLVNALGQVVHVENYNELVGEQLIQINTSDLENGIYFVNINVNGTNSTNRITVSK